jgi:hypothetical protein
MTNQGGIAMLIRKLVVVGLVGFVTLAATLATAEDAGAPSGTAVDGISFSDPDAPIADRFRFRLDPGRDSGRFFNFGSTARTTRDNERSYELSVVARAAAGIDVAFAQRGGVGFNAQGDIESERRGSELRLGSGLGGVRRDQPSATGKWYVFAASEDEALIWQPGARSDFGNAGSSLALQDRVEIGDVQAGITYEVYGIQASLAYVEREVSVRAGNRSISHDEDFTGLTITMRR